MKNRDYIKENKIDDMLMTVAELGHCALCDILGIKKFCNIHDEMGCKETILNWMEEDRELLYPLGTIVEFKLGKNERLGYYNGYNSEGFHRVTIYKDSVGKDSGCLVSEEVIKSV